MKLVYLGTRGYIEAAAKVQRLAEERGVAVTIARDGLEEVLR